MFSPWTEPAKRKLGNAKKGLKYYCKYDSLREICIWFYLPCYPDSGVCWHREAVTLEGLATKNILVPTGTETAASSGASACHRKYHGLILTPAITWVFAHSSSRTSSPTGSTDMGVVHKGHAQISFMHRDIWLVFLVWCLLQLPSSDSWFSLRDIFLLLLKSFQQLSFWLGGKTPTLTNPPWLLVTLPVLRN